MAHSGRSALRRVEATGPSRQATELGLDRLQLGDPVVDLCGALIDEGAPSLACRLYVTGEGAQGAPSVDDLAEVLRR